MSCLAPGGASVYNRQLWKDPRPWAGLWQASSCPLGPMLGTTAVLRWLLRRKENTHQRPHTTAGWAGGGRSQFGGSTALARPAPPAGDVDENLPLWPDEHKRATTGASASGVHAGAGETRASGCVYVGRCCFRHRHMLSADTRAVQVEFWAFPMPVHFPQESPVSSGVAQNTGLEPDRLGSAL